MSQLGGGYVAKTAGGVTAIVKDTPAATPAPAQPKAVIENTEKQGEDVNAILEALKKGGLAAVAKLATELTSPSSTEVQEQQSGSEPKQPMEGKGETQHTPMSARMAHVNTDSDFIKERESPRGLESTYSLREVGAGHFSALFANAFPSGHNNTIIKSGNRGTQARDKDKAKKAVIGFDYHDYFPQESWPFILRDIGFRKVGLQTAENLEFWTLCEPNGRLVLPRDIKMKSGSNTSHSGQHFGALVADATNTNKNTAFVCRLGAVWDTKTQGVPAQYYFAGAMVSRQQNYQLMLYYSDFYDDIYVYTGDAVQFRKELRQNCIGDDDIRGKIVTRLWELMVPEKKTKPTKPQVKKKVSLKDPVVEIEDDTEEEEEDPPPVKKKPKAEKEKKQLTEADIVAIALKAMEEKEKEKKAKGEKKFKIEKGIEQKARKKKKIVNDLNDYEDEDEDEEDFVPSSPEDDPWEEDPPRPSKGKSSSKGKGKGKGKANFKEEKPKKKKKTEKWDDWEGAESYDTNTDPEYWRKAGLGPPAGPVHQEQTKYSEERQREQIRMQVRAELEAEFEKKRQVERQAAWEREEKEREIQRRVAERERERDRDRDYDRNQDWDYNRGGYSGGKGGKGQSGRPDGRYSRDWTDYSGYRY